jgi:hypothetical protein
MEEALLKKSRPASKRAAPETRKAAGKTASKPTSKALAPVDGGKSKKASATTKPAKPKKPKLVRDSFTIPKEEYEVLATLKQRCVALARPSKKSELLRAGIKALAAMSDKSLLAAVQAVPSIKTGRPKQA